MAPPLQGFVRKKSGTQGCARASLALGWLVFAPLVLIPHRGQSSGQALIPATLHGLYDTFGLGIIGLATALLSIIHLMTYLANCQRIHQHLTTP